MHRQMRLLQNKWQSGTGWPKRLESLEIKGIRGWTGQRIDFEFPIVAICGENGSGKSTILQAAAASYAPLKGGRTRYASDFFPDTPWDRITEAEIRVEVREGDAGLVTSVRKPTERWRGNPKRKQRHVLYVDLRRLQPVSARVGFQRLAKPMVKEIDAEHFEARAIDQLSGIMGRRYDGVRMALTSEDPNRRVPVLTLNHSAISGFHQGGGELTITELLELDLRKYCLLLIDEIETSLHPSSQRRLMRELASLCREKEIQVILTTHSPYILKELPPDARNYILTRTEERQIVRGVSPDFALTMMDEESHPECDLYVEDERAEELLREILVATNRELIGRCQFIRYGAASVGKALGEMANSGRFPRPSLVFVDGDQPDMTGCIRLPGGDAPEVVVFDGLEAKAWGRLHERAGRDYAEVVDACGRAKTGTDHHGWVNSAANRLVIGGDVLWTLMCQMWAAECLDSRAAEQIAGAVQEALELGDYKPSTPSSTPPSSSTEQERPSEQTQSAPQESSEQRELFRL